MDNVKCIAHKTERLTCNFTNTTSKIDFITAIFQILTAR